jgi:hypothetical protein
MKGDDRSRILGKIVSVAADQLVVELHGGSDNFTVVGFDDVHYVATLGSYLVAAMQSDYVVLEVVGLREKDSGPERHKTTQMDKVSSIKFLDVVPVGSMPIKGGSFRFGVSSFPPLYADVLYAREIDLDRIFNVEKPMEDRPIVNANEQAIFGQIPHTIDIGTSSVFKGYLVKADVDAMFGGHLAVLGNTGSGKSCTVASVFQSVFMRQHTHAAIGAAFIIFDVNGEYRRALDDLPAWVQSSYFKATEPNVPIAPASEQRTDQETIGRFFLPHWFMTVDEWALLLRASERSQQPALRTALGLTTLFADQNANPDVVAEPANVVVEPANVVVEPANVVVEPAQEQQVLATLRNHVLAKILVSILQSDASSPSKSDRMTSLISTFNTPEITVLRLRQVVGINYGQLADAKGLTEHLTNFLVDDPVLPAYSNQPFSFDKLQAALDLALYYEEANGNKQIRDYCSAMVTRLKSVMDTPDYEFLREDAAGNDPLLNSADNYVDRLLGLQRFAGRYQKQRQLCVIDLNDASDEIVELASSVVSRLIFDRMRRADPRNKMPVHLILEEAHRYISEKPSRFAIDAAQTFQRIAKEGRKYGVFLIVASQRPSELSKTVLSQCNNYIIHRIQNPDDLSQIRQMTPFISDTVLRRLPSLPKQHALIFGNAVNIPTTFKVRDAKLRLKFQMQHSEPFGHRML